MGNRLPDLRGVALAVLAGLAFMPATGHALPMYAARTGMLCSQCHINPTGGGARNAFGFNYLQNGHSLTPRPVKEGEEAAALLSNKVGDYLSFGFDGRLMGYGSQAQKNILGLFLMQGGFYMSADLPQGLGVYYNNDLGQTRDFFVTKRGGIPGLSYVKVGKFKPPYGLKLDDHQSYIRTNIGFGTNAQDLGIEAGREVNGLSVIAAVLNGTPNPSVGQLDDNAAKAASAKVEKLVTVPMLGPGRVGGSYYWNHQGDTRSVRYGGYGTVQVGQRWTLLGELDQAVDDGLSDADGRYREGHAVAYAEAVHQVSRDLNLHAKYDLDYTSVGDYERYSLGGNWFFTPFAELKFDYRWNTETPSLRNPGHLAVTKNNDAYVQLHVEF